MSNSEFEREDSIILSSEDEEEYQRRLNIILDKLDGKVSELSAIESINIQGVLIDFLNFALSNEIIKENGQLDKNC
jgi:hypothetical protein